MKKWITLLLVMSMLLMLGACSPKAADPTSAETAAATEAEATEAAATEAAATEAEATEAEATEAEATEAEATEAEATEAEATEAEATEAEEAESDDSWSKVESKGVLIMGLDDNFPPMGFRDAKNEIVGFDVDLAKEVTKRLGVELELLPIDWKMKQNELDAGNIDCLWNGYSFTEERDRDNTLSAAYLGNDQIVIVMADSGIEDLAGMAGKTLALQEESSAEQALDANESFKDSLKEVVPFRDNVTAFLDLESGNSDGLLIDKVVGEYYVAQKDAADYVILTESLAPETYVIGFRKGEVQLKDKVEETLRAMKADGTLAAIATEWFGSDVTIFE